MGEEEQVWELGLRPRPGPQAAGLACGPDTATSVSTLAMFKATRPVRPLRRAWTEASEARGLAGPGPHALSGSQLPPTSPCSPALPPSPEGLASTLPAPLHPVPLMNRSHVRKTHDLKQAKDGQVSSPECRAEVPAVVYRQFHTAIAGCPQTLILRNIKPCPRGVSSPGVLWASPGLNPPANPSPAACVETSLNPIITSYRFPH